MKRHYALRLCFSFSLILTTNTFAQVVKIPDPNLESAVREQLLLPPGTPITQQDMLRLDRLYAADAQIESLTGLEYAHFLEDLDFSDNPISDLTPIAELPKIRRLLLNGIPISDLTFLKDLTRLNRLHLFACNITDITPLQNLIKLVILNLGENHIKDISPLANLTALETLVLRHNFIVDISSLANLTQLRALDLTDNYILDFSPIQGLSIPDLLYDEVCILPDLPIQERIENRSLPSVVAAWHDGLRDVWDGLPAVSHLSLDDRLAYHDIFWNSPAISFELYFQKTPPWSHLRGPIEVAIAKRNKLLAKNPNMLFLAFLISTYTQVGNPFPKDWSGWLRDEDGNLVKAFNSRYFLDLTQPEVQDFLVEQAVVVSKCGLFDGILYDSWHETISATDILKRIREKVPEDFIIIINANRDKQPLSIPYTNGSFMETFPRVRENGYTRDDIIEIETNLIWFEAVAREPQINILRGFGIGAEPPDSPRNRQWMRLFTTMSLTLSDGYALYTLGTIGGQKQYQKHIWYPFWDADLGQPVSPTTQRYQDIEGLYIREFTNGWAVYNRSGASQAITLPHVSIGVSSNKQDITHLLPDLDGEIYLKAKNPADVNGDWVVNILDLVYVANNFGKSAPDINNDGVVNILDLVHVAQQFGQ